MTDLGFLSGGTRSAAVGINAIGDVIGRRRTVQVSSALAGTGTAMGEVHDLDDPKSPSRIVNASGLVQIGKGVNIATAGFIVSRAYGDTINPSI